MSNKINTKKNSILLFLIWPFMALGYAIQNYKAVWAKDIVWLFVIFYGFTLALANNNGGENSRDAYRYRVKFTAMAHEDITFGNIASQFYDEDSETQNLDIIELSILFLLSRFTDNYHVLFCVFGLIFGYFYSRNIWYLIEKAGKRITSANIPVIITFAFIVGFWEINGFRFWSASHIFLYGTLPFLYEGKKKYLWFSILSVFMHFAFLLPVAILGIFVLTGSRVNMYFFLFITTFFIKELNISQIRDFLSGHLPAIFLPKIKTYTNEDYAEKLSTAFENVNWYVTLYQQILKWTIVSFIVVMFLKGRKFITHYKGMENLFCFTLLLCSVANVFALMPSGGRFVILSNLFSMAMIFFYMQYAPRGKAMKNLLPFALPGLVLFSVVSMRIGLDTMGFFSVFGNPLLSLFFDINTSLIELIKGMLGFS